MIDNCRYSFIRLICLFLVIVCLFLSACSHNDENVEGPEAESPKYDLEAYSLNVNGYLWDSNLGSYFLSVPERLIGMLYFHEKGTKTWDILCNQPNCSHSDRNCGAFGGYHLYYYDGSFYSVYPRDIADSEIGSELMKISPDGSRRTTVAKLPVVASRYFSGSTSSGGQIMFSRGFLINSVSETISPGVTTNYLFVINLKTGETRELLNGYFSDYVRLGYVCDVEGEGNRILCSANLYQSGQKMLLDIDLTDGGVCRTLPYPEDMYSIYSVDSQTMTYYSYQKGIVEYDIQDGTEALKKAFDYYGLSISLYEGYYYGTITVDATFFNRKFVMMDSEMNVIVEAELPAAPVLEKSENSFPESLISLGGVADGSVWFYSGAGVLTHYAEIEDLKQGKVEFHPVYFQ